MHYAGAIYILRIKSFWGSVMDSNREYELFITSQYYLEVKLKGSDDKIDGFFMECHGFKRSQEVIEICEVTPQQWGKHDPPPKHGRVVRTKIPGNSKIDNIILKRGMTISPTMWNWFKLVEEGDWANQFRDGDLTIYGYGSEGASSTSASSSGGGSSRVRTQARFRFTGAWPVSYKIADVKADSNEFQLEELELAVNSFYRVQPSGEEYKP